MDILLKLSILFTLFSSMQLLAESDAKYLYQNDKDIAIKLSGKDVKVVSLKDKRVLLDSSLKAFFIDKSNASLKIRYKIIKKDGGFDVVYSVKNPTKTPQLMPDFQIPGIFLEAKNSLDILNTNTKQYMEKRSLSELKSLNENFFTVSAFRQISHNGKILEEETHYASDTLSPYSPVIVAKDDEVAVGVSLNYPILRYIDKSKTIRGKHNVLMNKLYPKMRIYKDGKSWIFKYLFDDSGSLVARIGSEKEYIFTIPVRFSKPRFWLLTLHPYKEYFLKHYPIKNPTLKDVKPILLVNFAFYGDSITDKSPRGWAWTLENVDKNGHSYLPLKMVASGLSEVMKTKGYEKILFTTFSGVYDARVSPKLNEELPFQILNNLKQNMDKDLYESLNIFKKNRQKFGFWWGIAGMMPIDKEGKVINFDTWLPYSDRPFVLDNSSHIRYAKRELDSFKKVGTDILSLDAYVRMEENDRITWLKAMKKYLPKTKFILEQQVDFMHTFAGIILQPESEAFDRYDSSKAILTKPALLAHYLNPKSEIWVWIKQNGDNKKYIQNLVKWGYTPLILMPSGTKFNHDQRDVRKRILDNIDYFLDVHNFDNSKISHCMDNIDNDGDSKIDWPYDEGCKSPVDLSE